MSRIPEKPTLDGLEARWAAVWEERGTYRFDRSHERAEIFSIDTPPPTVSGSLHMGSAFGYVQTDSIARYQRMRGRHVFYPMGWDDNGLPTERRVQNYFGVRCEPHLPYDPAFVPPEKPGKDVVSISRPNFLELCEKLVAEDEAAFEDLWRRLVGTRPSPPIAEETTALQRVIAGCSDVRGLPLRHQRLVAQFRLRHDHRNERGPVRQIVTCDLARRSIERHTRDP